MRIATLGRAVRSCAASQLPRAVAMRSVAARGMPRMLSTRANKSMAIPDGSAYAVLGVSRDVDKETLHAIYKSLAREWHPDRHQGDGRDEAERKFQEISEAFQTLSNPVRRAAYDGELDAAETAAEQAVAAKRFRAQSWNTEVPNVAERLRNAKREEPGMPPHIIAGTLAFVTGNFILVLNWLGG